MPAYNTGSGSRWAPADPVPGSAVNRRAGTVQESAVTQAEVDPTNVGSTDRPREVTGEHAGIMAEVPQSLKDQSILILRAEFNAAHAALDRSVAEVDKHIKDIEQAKTDATVPKQMLHDFSTRLDTAPPKATPCWTPWRTHRTH